MNPAPEHVAAPVPPASAPPYAFPLLATVAPVAVSLALWGITGSVFALVFAALGPAVALASLADARLQSRRRSSRERDRFSADLEAARSEIGAAHAREAGEIAAASPSARRLVCGEWPESEQWLGDPAGEVTVCIGWGERASSLVLDGAAVGDRGRGPEHESLRALSREAARLDDAPILVDARLGIGVLGRPPLAAAVARGILVQVLASVSPADHGVVLEASDAEEWRWLRDAPHPVRELSDEHGSPAEGAIARVVPHGDRRRGGVGEVRASIVVAVAENHDELPRWTRVVIEATATGARVARHPDRSLLAAIRLEPVSREQAVAVARGLARHAHSAGIARTAATVPERVTFAECAVPITPAGPEHAEPGPGTAVARHDGLGCVPAMTAVGPLRLDLASQGPHAVVGGTTGSGKSELLIGWVLAMAREHSPLEVSVLLVDFKGGSAFASLAALPHCVGMITDLDGEGASRALASLAAELRRRERHLAASAAKSIDVLAAAAALPRLVIVVDEFAAMVGGFPELHALFADIAARGRSLGVHLVLCTQRPAGVIRDAVLANSGLRLSLRVNNRADSLAVIGTDAAAELPVEPRGRGWIAADGGEPVLAQFPLVTAADVDAVRGRWADHPYRPHRPWLDPLPAVLPLASVPAGEAADSSTTGVALGVPFGVLDDPAAQAQPAAAYRPGEHGNLLVVGGAGSGKSTLLSTLERSAMTAVRRPGHYATRRVPSDIEGAWDELQETLEGIRGAERLADVRVPPRGRAGEHRLLLLDDLDALLPRFPEEYGGELLEVLGAILREGPGRGIHCVLTAQRLTAGLHPIGALCGSRILLRMPSRQEFVLAGGDGGQYAERLPPGGGHWQGSRLQVAVAGVTGPTRAAVPTRAAGRPPALLELTHPLAIVSRSPSRFAERLRRALPLLAAPGSIVEIGAASSVGVSISSGPRGLAILGDADSWQAQWGALGSLRASHTIVVEGYAAAEFRTVTRERTLPPPLTPGGNAFWLLAPGEPARRGVLPDAA